MRPIFAKPMAWTKQRENKRTRWVFRACEALIFYSPERESASQPTTIVRVSRSNTHCMRWRFLFVWISSYSFFVYCTRRIMSLNGKIEWKSLVVCTYLNLHTRIHTHTLISFWWNEHAKNPIHIQPHAHTNSTKQKKPVQRPRRVHAMLQRNNK